MISANNELVIHRNESFSIDRTIVNKDGSPYIVSSGMRNPHLLITVSSTKYNQPNQFKLSYLLPLVNLPRFNFTTVIPLRDLTNESGEPLYTSGYPTGLTLSVEDEEKWFITAYYKGDLVKIEPNDAVFSYEENGKTYYKYWKPDSLEDGSSGKWTDYIFRFVKEFAIEDTSKLVEQTYYYSIQLVAGNPPSEYAQVLPILNPTKMSVLSNLEGRML